MKEDRFLKKQIQTLNRHLPKRKYTLASLLKRKRPRIENRDGSSHRFKKEELKYLSEILPASKHSKLRLPIILRISPQLGRGATKISGKVEREVLRKVLGKEEKEGRDELLIYRPEVRVIRKRLPTTTQYAFLISSRERSNFRGMTR